MEVKDLDKNLAQILSDKYIVPLYQRNFAWEEDEISLLLQDIYESFLKPEKNNYFIGSLVVLKRQNGDFEVIDGQQRLTTIMLIAKVLNLKCIVEPKLFYDSRPEVESFFSSFYKTGKTTDVTFDYKVSHLINAVDFIRSTKLNIESNEERLTLENISDLEDFKLYFEEKVILVRVEIPNDTDVANYFEIMNNRGEQLQKHEILKAKLIDKIKDDKGEHDKLNQVYYAKIWDACSQMDIHIQKLFSKEDRIKFFGNNYDAFTLVTNLNNDITESNLAVDDEPEIHSIDYIINNHNLSDITNNGPNDVDDESDDSSIIDFPNFLMHILRLCYNEEYKISKGSDIPLNENELLAVYDVIESKIDATYFISNLLYYRTVFDKYIIKASNDENAEDSYKWSLEKPYKYVYESKNTTSLKYKNTFGHDYQERIIKCISMLQVSFRTRKYKNWLQEVLIWFKVEANIDMNAVDFIKKMDLLALQYFNLNNSYKQINVEKNYAEGTNTPHFIFNFLDYLLWVKDAKSYNFDFKYRNSVEHHLPQSYRNLSNDSWIDSLGNLCLVSKSSNSKMNNESPIGKADKNGKYYKSTLPPKQKMMYEMTNNNDWTPNDIKLHYDELCAIVLDRENVLNEKFNSIIE